ncbi:hypothetical protein [Bythopirellula polymerisocia]|uniref:hypothetical protein n=1 Tax=Bythopirellula polymerisocia TaxID=2528003 RepID=UPI0011B7E217|nr:hypothetical protein [Bythopirellula polymerisocia]
MGPHCAIRLQGYKPSYPVLVQRTELGGIGRWNTWVKSLMFGLRPVQLPEKHLAFSVSEQLRYMWHLWSAHRPPAGCGGTLNDSPGERSARHEYCEISPDEINRAAAGSYDDGSIGEAGATSPWNLRFSGQLLPEDSFPE